MSFREWGAFGLLSLLWGSSFLWIKVALQEVGPFTLVGWRLVAGLVTMALILALRRPELPRQRATWFHLAMLGVINITLPFFLISWGQKTIDSAVASVLNSTVPLFTLVIAHLLLPDERITLQRTVGLLAGFAGVVVLVLRELGPGTFRQSLLGQLAVLLAAVSYAVSGVYVRRYLRQVPQLLQAFVPMAAAQFLIWPLAFLFERPVILPTQAVTWIALTFLGVLGLSAAYILFFYLIHSVGATRASLVTYPIAVVGVAMGVIFLGEQLDINLILGTLLVILGVGVVNWRAAGRPKPAAESGKGSAA